MAGTHYVETGLFWVDSLGNIIDKNNLKLSGALRLGTQERRVLPNPSIPNSLGYPRVSDFILAEAEDDFVLAYQDPGRVVTSLQAAAPDLNALLENKLRIWYDPGVNEGITLSGSDVIGLHNLSTVTSGNYDLAKNGAWDAPTIDTGAYSRNAVLLRNLNNASLIGVQGQVPWASPFSTPGKDIWMVCAVDTSWTNSSLFGFTLGLVGSNSNYFTVNHAAYLAGDPARAFYQSNQYPNVLTPNGFTTGVMSIIHFKCLGLSSHHISLDRGTYGVSTTALIGAATYNVIILGNRPNGGIGTDMDFGELVVTSGADDTDRDNVFNYLQNKWGLA